MKHTIYYFTGTGNTLDIAKSISKKVNAELIPISKSLKEISGDLIGIAFPIYMFNAPRIVYKFLSKIKSCKYLYLVMTMGGNSGRTVEKIKSRLNKGVIINTWKKEIKARSIYIVIATIIPRITKNYIMFDNCKFSSFPLWVIGY